MCSPPSVTRVGQPRVLPPPLCQAGSWGRQLWGSLSGGVRGRGAPAPLTPAALPTELRPRLLPSWRPPSDEASSWGQGGAESQAGGQAPGTLTTGACFLLRPRQGGHLAGRAPRACEGRAGDAAGLALCWGLDAEGLGEPGWGWETHGEGRVQGHPRPFSRAPGPPPGGGAALRGLAQQRGHSPPSGLDSRRSPSTVSCDLGALASLE